MDTEDIDGQWIQGNSRYSEYRRRVDTEDTGGQWIQGNSRYSGYRRRVERIQTGSGYRQTVDVIMLINRKYGG